MVSTRVLTVALAALVLFRSSGAAAEDLRLGNTVQPRSESLRLVLDADKTDYTGSVHLDLEVKERLESFRMHAEDMTLGSMVMRSVGKNGKPSGAAIAVTALAGESGLVTLTPATALAPGKYSLDIDFSNDFSTKANGLYRMQSDGRGYLFTQFEADDAREAFPCFDEPGFKIPWDMTVVVPEKQLVLFNSPIAKETTKDGQRTVVFRRTPPLPSYLVALAAGPLETVAVPGCSIPTRIVTVQGQSALAATAVEATPKILAALERWFGQKYPFEKLDLLAVPEYWYGAMENPGAITFSDRILLVDSGAASPAQRRGMASITAHELAHMWFGDYVTMSWWDDLWLNESFADWMGDKITEEVFPEFELEKSELLSIQNVMTGDSRPSSQAVHRKVDALENLLQNVGVQYNKGKCVLGMFEQWIGPENFRKGVLDYLQAHAWGNAQAGDLWAALSKVSGEDVSGAMATFLDQPGIPLVTVEPQADGSVTLSQARFHNAGSELPAQSWKIPVSLKFGAGTASKTETVLLSTPSRTWKPASGRIESWVLPNAETRGYYRWTLPAAMLDRVTADPRATMTPAERIGFIGNLSALLDAGLIHGDQYLGMLGRFADDPEPHVVGALASGVERLDSNLITPELKSAFAVYVRRTLGPSLDRWGLEPKPGEPEGVTLVRPRILNAVGDLGQDPRVQARASELAHAYLENSAALDPSIRGTVLDLAAQNGDRALFDAYRGRFEAAKVPAERGQFLSGLGSFRDPALADEALHYALTGPLRPNEVGSIPFGQSDTPEGRERSYRWMKENWTPLTARLPKEFTSRFTFMAGGCDEKRLEDARVFFTDPSRDSPGIRYGLARLTDSTGDCLRLREREGGAVTAYLGQLVGSR